LVIGPVRHRIDPERLGSFVVATGDDPDRWVEAAPPGYAATLLFAVAADFLWDPRIQEHSRTLIHVDQLFEYRDVLPLDEVEIVGTVARARERGGASFVTFEMTTTSSDGPLLESSSTFLMSPEPAGVPPPDEEEAAAHDKEADDRPGRAATPDVDGLLPQLMKSVSRADLVRYAAATRDFNPIHWDHGAARAAGLPGIVAHGLLMHSWVSQAAASVGEGLNPIAKVKTRFRNPLRPATQATVDGAVRELSDDGDHADLWIAVNAEGRDVVTATATVRAQR
jgi:acyl dehydratase